MSRSNRPPGLGSTTADSPIHDSSARGRVKYSKTRSGGALMCTEAVTGSALIARLHRLLQALQLPGPELGEEVPQRGEPLRPGRVEPLLAARADRHQPGLPEHLQVLRDGLLGDVEPPGDLVDRQRPV